MGAIREFFQRDIVKRLLVLLALVVFLYVMKNLLDLFLLTFLFTYLIHGMRNFIIRMLKKFIPINHVLITVILYIAVFVIISSIIYKYIPIIINQTVFIIRQMGDFDIDSTGNIVQSYLSPMVQNIDISKYSQNGVEYLIQVATNVGKWSINVFIALMLSMFFMLEIDPIKHFLSKLKNSRLAGIYNYLGYFGSNFLNSFGKVMQAQIILSLINTVLSVIILYLMNFHQLMGLGVMIFILNLIPVLGTLIALLPLSIIAFKIGGTIKVLYVLIMIILLHSLGTYVLNPKLMADKTELPTFFIFVILIISEHFMGVWGLLVGIPLFMFILDLLNVKLVDE